MVQKMKYKHFNKDMALTKDDEQNFKNADKCYVCNKKYSAKDICVRDHCHITGIYRGSAHEFVLLGYESKNLGIRKMIQHHEKSVNRKTS